MTKHEARRKIRSFGLRHWVFGLLSSFVIRHSSFILWATLFVVAAIAVGPSFVTNLRPGRHEIADFFQEWASARNHFEGLPVYTHQDVTMWRYQGYRKKSWEFGIHYNAHPPASVLLALPLARLDYSDAFLVWSLASLAAGALSGWLVVRQLRLPFTLLTLIQALTLLLVCNPFRQQMHQGQLNLILLLLVTGTWAAERSGRPAVAGLLLGLATAFKLFPGLLFVYYLLRWRWDVIGWGVAGFVLINVVAVGELGVGAFESYLRDSVPAVGVFADWWPNISLPGFWLKLFDGRTGRVVPLWHNPTLARFGIVLSWVVVLGLLARATLRGRTQRDHDATFGLTLVAMLLLSPVTWDHYAVLLLVPVVVFWQRVPKHTLARVLLVGGVVGLWLTPMVYWRAVADARIDNWMTLVAAPWQTLTGLSMPCYALIALFAAGLSLCPFFPPRPRSGGEGSGVRGQSSQGNSTPSPQPLSPEDGGEGLYGPTQAIRVLASPSAEGAA
jgi:hypothetical protein